MPDLSTYVHLPLGATFIAIGATKLISTRRPAPGYRCVWSAVLCIGVADILNAPLAYQWAEREIGIGWPMVISHLALIATAACAFDLVHLMLGHDQRHQVRSRAIALVVSMVAIAPWLIDPPTTAPPAVAHMSVYYDATWQSTLHWSVALGYVTWQLFALRWITLQRSRTELPGPPRTGMNIMAWSYLGAITGFMVNLAVQAAWLTGHGPRWTTSSFGVTMALAGLSMTTMGVGIAWPYAHRKWTQTAWRIPASPAGREFRLIHHYWSALTAQVPETTYFPQDVTGRPKNHEQLMWQRARMVTEIHDLRRRLAHYIDHHDQQKIRRAVQIHWPTSPSAAIAVDEVTLRLALRRLRTGAPSLDPSYAPSAVTSTLAEAAAAIATTSRVTRHKAHQKVLDHIFDKELR